MKVMKMEEFKAELDKLSSELKNCKETILLNEIDKEVTDEEVRNLSKTITSKQTMIQQLSSQLVQSSSERTNLEIRLKECLKVNSNLRSAFRECLNRDEAVTLAASKRIRALRLAIQEIVKE